MITDTYKVQTRAQTKAQANAPTVNNAQKVAQKPTPEIVKLPIETEKKRDVKALPSEYIQQPSQSIVLPPGSVLPPIIIPPNVRPPLKPPDVDKVATGPNTRPGPNMDIEENSPHQEGIIAETYTAPD